MKRKVRIFLRTLCLVISILISFFFILVDFIILFRYGNTYILKKNIDQEYIKEAISEEINVKMPEDVEIIRVEYRRVWNQSNYKILYLQDGNIEEENYIYDADRTNLDKYMEENAKTNNGLILSIILIIVILQIFVPLICLVKLIKEIKNKDL